MFRNYFKTAFRNLQRNRVYSLINILGLSLGLACAMLIMLYVKDEVSFDRFQKGIGQVYRICGRNINPDGSVQEVTAATGLFQGPRFASGIPEIKAFVRFEENRLDLKTGSEIKSQQIYYADPSFFSVFTFPLLSGDPLTALKEPKSVVLSEDMAKKQFGTTDAIGKTMLFEIEGKFTPFIVSAVARRCPQNSSIKFDVLLRKEVSQADETFNENWMSIFLNTFVVLSPNANVQAVESKMRKIYMSDAAPSISLYAQKYDVKTRTEYFLQPFLKIHLSEQLNASNGLVDGSSPAFSYILSGIALFILGIACINFVNLTVARSVKRAKEIGIRKVVGSGKKQLVLQFMGESFILCFIAFTLAIGIVQLILPLFNTLANKALALSYLLDIKLVAGYVGLFLITGILAGFYSAIVLSSYNPVQTLYSRFTLSGKNYLQKSLVVLQFALASFLIIATITIVSQFNYLSTQKLGYDDSNLVTVKKDGLSRDAAKLLKNELLKDPGILDVASKNGGSWGTIAKVNGEKQLGFAWETVDEEYLPLLKIPIVQGRNFSVDFPSDSTKSILVNETFAKAANWKNPIGQILDFWYSPNEKYRVVGVVKDHHYESLTKLIGPQVFTMKPGNQLGKVFIKIRPGTETASLRHIEKTFKRLFPVSPYAYEFKDQENLKNYEAEAKWKQIMLFSAVLTVFISCIGLFGLSVLAAEKRTREIGIRKILGASVSGVVTILSTDFMKLVFLSLLAAIPLSWLASVKWLENYPYRITLSWGMFAWAAALVIFIALITVSFQAIKAAVANPAESLRAE